MKITIPDYFPVEIDKKEINEVGDVFDLFCRLVETMKEHNCVYATSANGIRMDIEDLDATVEQLRMFYYHVPIKIEYGA